MIYLKLIGCILAVLALCRYWVLKDFKEIQRTQGTNVLTGRWHRVRWLMKASELAVVCFVFALSIKPFTLNLMRFTSFALFAAVLWWMLFDYWLSLKRGRNPYYIGLNAASDKFLLRFRDKWNLTDKETHLIIKLPLLVITFLFLLYTTL